MVVVENSKNNTKVEQYMVVEYMEVVYMVVEVEHMVAVYMVVVGEYMVVVVESMV